MNLMIQVLQLLIKIRLKVNVLEEILIKVKKEIFSMK